MITYYLLLPTYCADGGLLRNLKDRHDVQLGGWDVRIVAVTGSVHC